MTRKLTLKKSIVRGDNRITELTLREPKAGDLRGLKLMDVLQFDTDALATLTPRIASPQVIEADIYAMDIKTLTALATEIASFFTDDAETTEPASNQASNSA